MPGLTCEQVREIDRLALEKWGMPSLLLMENAALNAVAVVLDTLENQLLIAPSQAKVTLLCGSGNNGGDGYAIARHLHHWGVEVAVLALQSPDAMTGDARINALICQRMRLPITLIDNPAQVTDACAKQDVVIDALLGTGFHRPVREPIRSIIAAINGLDQPCVVAIDVPSGLNADTGQPCDIALHADVTVTFVDRKVGFDAPSAADYLGQVHIADIGVGQLRG